MILKQSQAISKNLPRMSDCLNDLNDVNITEIYPEIVGMIPPYAVGLILTGLDVDLDKASLSISEIISKLDNPCILYCLEQGVTNPLHEKFNYRPLAILYDIFNINVVTMQQIGLDGANANVDDLQPGQIYTGHQHYKSNDVSPEYYKFISIVYGLYKKSKNTRTPEGLDRIIKYLEEYSPLVKSSGKT